MQAKRGGLKDTLPDDLLVTVFKATLERTGINPAVRARTLEAAPRHRGLAGCVTWCLSLSCCVRPAALLLDLLCTSGLLGRPTLGLCTALLAQQCLLPAALQL